ncbi:MAG: hypothetical protein R3Y18_05210 [Bacillota bacterium]
MRIFGKLNLFLNVFGVVDGFHGIESVFAPCFDIYDEIFISVADETSVEFSPADFVYLQSADYVERYEKAVGSLAGFEDNTARAVRLFCGKFGVSGVAVRVKKGVPFSAGMGGSSASAVAVLKCLCEKFEKSFSDVSDIVNALGSDLAGMWGGGVSFCEGRGEIARDIAGEIGGFAVVCTPSFGVSTREVFQAFDRLSDVKIFAGVEDCKNGEFDYFANFGMLENSLETASFAISVDLENFAGVLREKSGVNFKMTGSGSGFFTLVKDLKTAREIHEKVREYCDFSAISRI